MNGSVQIGPLTESLPQFLSDRSYSKFFVIADTKTRKYCYPLLKPLLPSHQLVTVKSGETHKNLGSCEIIWQAMTDAALDRHALVLNIGGGVIGDMGGFCAATYKRGVDFVQIPTTLLSQVDASVGGKLGIDFNGLKNHLGVFALPSRVLIDPVFLQTLPPREIRSGFAEIVKHCLIADAEKWETIRVRDFEQQDWPDLISHSVGIKQRVVEADPREKGLRKILNFGHTLGHAIETWFLEKPAAQQLLHGEAIAAGMVMEAYLAYRKKMIDKELLQEIEEFIFSVYGKTIIAPEDVTPILRLTAQDKKNKGGEVRFSLIDGRGSCTYDVPVSAGDMRKALAYYQY